MLRPRTAFEAGRAGRSDASVSPAGGGRDRGGQPPGRTQRSAGTQNSWRSEMVKFTHRGIAAPLRHSNVDTDQIIPASTSKRITRTGYEDALFSAWRQDRTSANHPVYNERIDPDCRARLRYRFFPRTRGMGAERLRVQGRGFAGGSPIFSAATPVRADWSPLRSSNQWSTGSGVAGSGPADGGRGRP